MVGRLRFIRLQFGTVRQWHWISSAVCLVGMLLFALTGITLNHADIIPADPSVHAIETQVPAKVLSNVSSPDADDAPLPATLRHWLASELDIHIASGAVGEWMAGEVYMALPRPGGDAWLSIDLTNGELIYERTDRGWVSYLNDLHKGRDTGTVWRWFIDVFAVATVVFCVTGLLLLVRHAGHRPATWPTVALGLVVPVILIILFIH